MKIQLTHAILSKLTPEVLTRWAFDVEDLDDDKATLEVEDSPQNREIVSNMLAVECADELKAIGLDSRDTGLRPAGGDGPVSLRRMLSL